MTTYQRDVYKAALFAANRLSELFARQVSEMMYTYPTLTSGKLDSDIRLVLGGREK